MKKQNTSTSQIKFLEVLTRIEKYLITSKGYKPGIHCLIAISGGQDSMCLPIFLRSFQRKWQMQFSFIFCHHGWQKESFYSVLHSTKYCLVTENAHFITLNPNTYSVSKVMPIELEKNSYTKIKNNLIEKKQHKSNQKNLAFFDSYYKVHLNFIDSIKLLTILDVLKVTNSKIIIKNYLSRARRIKFTSSRVSKNRKVFDNTSLTQQTTFSEAKARDWRFRSIFRVYCNENYKLIVTGHTATDRVETALLQLIRGTSLHGLTSLQKQKVYKKVYPKYFNYSAFSNTD